jgi:glycosyltransferase involved in cell wall biosynthesis
VLQGHGKFGCCKLGSSFSVTAGSPRGRLSGYWRRLQFEWSQYRWRQHAKRCREAFDQWRRSFIGSEAEVLIGAHLHRFGGVRNHLLAISQFSSLRTLLVPTEAELQRYGGEPFGAHREDFIATPPPKPTFAVHTHVLPQLIDWASAQAPRRLRWVHTHHLLYYPEAGRDGLELWQEELNKAMLRGASLCDLCLCVSRWETEVLRTQFGIDAHYLPNGVDVSRCDQARAERFRRKFRLNRPFVLWVGRPDLVKNPYDFIRLASMFPHLQFVMIGGITSEDVRRDYSFNAPGNLLLLPQVAHLGVLDAIAACDALVVTSFREGLPTLVLEAMALQRQIVIPDEPGCLDATDGNANALVYRQGDMDDLRQQLDSAVHNPKHRDNARRRVLAEFDWRVVARKLDHVYKTGEVP